MANPATSKLLPVKTPNVSTLSDTRKTMTFAYGFIVTFIAATLLIIFYPSASYSPSSSSSFPWLLRNIFNLKNSFLSSNGSHFSHFFPNSSSSDFDSNTHLPISQNPPFSSVNNVSTVVLKSNLTQMVSSSVAKLGTVVVNGTMKNLPSESQSSSISKRNYTVVRREKEGSELYESMLQCNVFDGKWVRDDPYPLYAPGSCPHIDVPFNCFLNGRPDNDYVKYRWQPNDCNIPSCS